MDRIGASKPQTPPPATPRAEAKPDANQLELQTKLGKLSTDKFGGDSKKVFDHYDANKDGGLAHPELKTMLGDAKVGNIATRGLWADGILDKIDGNRDRKIQWDEFQGASRK